MRSLTLAAVIALSASAAMANIPTMSLPDLTFPAPSGDVTQGCSNLASGKIICE